MTDQLQDLLPALEQLPSELQEEALTHIRALIEEMLLHTSKDRADVNIPSLPEETAWQDPFGAWSDLPDSMLDELDQLRHSNPPTPPCLSLMYVPRADIK